MTNKAVEVVTMKTKSFRYSPEEHPKVERWIQSLAKNNIDFSKAIRKLIEENETGQDEIRAEIEDLRKQVEYLRRTGGRQAPMSAQTTQEQELGANPDYNKQGPEKPSVNTGFIRNRYFS